MLDGYGFHTIVWDSADERLGDFLVASHADATGRDLELHASSPVSCAASPITFLCPAYEGTRERRQARPRRYCRQPGSARRPLLPLSSRRTAPSIPAVTPVVIIKSLIY